MINSFNVVYVATGDPQSSYTRMAAISAHTVRRVEPAAQITVLTDVPVSVFAGADEFFPAGTRIEPVLDLPHATATLRSRHLKTTLPERIDGPFIFLDCDAIAVAPFRNLIMDDRYDFRAAYDRNRFYPAHNASERWTLPLYRELGWKFPPPRYFNSGVMFFGGSDGAKALSQRWHSLWLEQIGKTTEHRDQPSLARAAALGSERIGVLPIAANALVGSAACFARGASILHYFCAEGMPREGTLLRRILLECFTEEDFDVEMMEAIMASIDPERDIIPYSGTENEFTYYRAFQGALRACKRVDMEAFGYLMKDLLRRGPLSPRTVFMLLAAGPLLGFYGVRKALLGPPVS